MSLILIRISFRCITVLQVTEKIQGNRGLNSLFAIPCAYHHALYVYKFESVLMSYDWYSFMMALDSNFSTGMAEKAIFQN